MTVIKLRPLWYALSGTLIAASIAVWIIFGFKFGIDFTGGSVLSARFEGDRPSTVEIERSLDGIDVGTLVIQPVGERDANIRMKTLTEAEHTAVSEKLSGTFRGVTELSFNAIGPAIGAELREKAIKALIIAFIAIM